MSEQIERIKSTVKDLSPSRKEIEAELRAEEADQELQRIIDRYAGRVKLKGFRQGKAPRDMVKQMFAPDIHQSLFDSLVPKVLDEVLTSHAIHPVGMPVVKDLSYEEGQPLRLKAVVETWPDFPLPVYKKIRVAKKDIAVSDRDIDKTLEELREKSAEYLPVEGRGVGLGDYVVIELQGKDRKTKRMMPAEKVVVLAGHEGNEKIINDQLLGMAIREEKRFSHAYPADHKNRKLAGKDIEYLIRVVSIKEKQVPELNDEFAKHLGEYDSLNDLKEKIKSELLAARERAVKSEQTEEVLKAILEKTEIDLPPSLVEEETQSILKRLLSSAPQRNQAKETADALRASAGRQAEQNLRRHLVLKKIAEAEGLKVGEEEVDEEIRILAKTNNIPLARAMETFNQEGRRESLKSSLLLKKTVDFLAEQAIID
jgi:trigger factor